MNREFTRAFFFASVGMSVASSGSDHAAVIGEAVPEPGMVTMRSLVGSERVVTLLTGEQLRGSVEHAKASSGARA